MAVIKTYKKGNTTIRIHNDGIPKTEEELQLLIEEAEKLVRNQYMLQKDKTA